MSYVLAKHIRKNFNAGTSSIIFSLYAFKSGVSGGTSTTMLNLFSHYPLKHLAKSLAPYSISPVRPTAPSKPPKSNLFYRLFGFLDIPELGGLQTDGLMAAVDTAISHRSWGLYESIAQNSSRPDVSYGSHFRFSEYMRAKSFLHGTIWHFSLMFTGMLLAFPPTRWILSPLITRFVIQAPGEGPSRESMRGDFMHYKALGIADTEKKEKVVGHFNSPHGGYAITALTLSSAAEVILRGDLGATEAGKLGGGILTPAM